jgi:hypothetical protein
VFLFVRARWELSHLRLAFNLALADEVINRDDNPIFKLPKDSKPRKGFLEIEEYKTLRDAMPEHLRDTIWRYGAKVST